MCHTCSTYRTPLQLFLHLDKLGLAQMAHCHIV